MIFYKSKVLFSNLSFMDFNFVHITFGFMKSVNKLQVMQMHIVGRLLIFVVPAALAIMNLMWFGKIVKGLRSTLAKNIKTSHTATS